MCNGDSNCAVGCQTASHKLRHVSAISTSSPTGLFVSIGFSFKREEKNQGLIRGFLLVLISFFVLGSSYVRLVTRLCPSEEQSESRSCRSFAMTSGGCLSGCLATPEVMYPAVLDSFGMLWIDLVCFYMFLCSWFLVYWQLFVLHRWYSLPQTRNGIGIKKKLKTDQKKIKRSKKN